jgi:bleomycin hydrolase
LLLLALVFPLWGQSATTAPPKSIGSFVVESELPRLPVLEQGRTGTCWCFATTSFLETELARIHGKPIDLSEMFTVRASVIEKAKRYVDAKGKAVFGEGGLSHDVIAMVQQYGVLPQDQYSGLPEGSRGHEHSEMFLVIKAVLDKLVEQRRRSPHWVKAVAAITDGYLGSPPADFEMDGKRMTPVEYARDVLQFPLGDYLEVMSYSYAPFHQEAMLTVDDNWMKYDRYLNLPLDEFMAGFDHALATGFSVAVDIDVSERTYRAPEGVGTLTPDLEAPGAITQEVRDEMFATKRTTDDHLLHVVGVSRDPEGRRYYIAKDSWGIKSGKLQGYRMLSENYIRAKVLAYMVHRDGLPKPSK